MFVNTAVPSTLGFEAVDGKGLALAAPDQGQVSETLIRRSKRLAPDTSPRVRKRSRRGEATQPAFRLDGPTARRFVTASLHEPDVVILDAVPVQRTPTPTSDGDLLEPAQRALTPPDDDTLEAAVLYQVRAVLRDAEHAPMPPDYIPDYVQLAYIVERVQNWRLWNQQERAPEADIRREICKLESELWELDVAADAFRRTG